MQWRICFFYIQRAQHVHIDLSCIQQRNVTADDENASLALKFLRALRQWRIRKKICCQGVYDSIFSLFTQ